MKIKKILFTSPFAQLQGKELGLLFTILIGAMSYCLFFIIQQRYILAWKPQWLFTIVVFFYTQFVIISNSFFAHRLAVKKAKANLLIASICMILIIVENGLFFYLYFAQILVSKNCLFIFIPVSWAIAFICIEVWIRISTKNKKMKNE